LNYPRKAKKSVRSEAWELKDVKRNQLKASAFSSRCFGVWKNHSSLTFLPFHQWRVLSWKIAGRRHRWQFSSND